MRKFSEEHKRNIGIAISNYWKKHKRIAWNKGLTKETDERVRKYANSLKGHEAFGGFETRFLKGHKRTEESIRKQIITISGEGNMNWKGGISKEPYGFDFTEALKNL